MYTSSISSTYSTSNKLKDLNSEIQLLNIKIQLSDIRLLYLISIYKMRNIIYKHNNKQINLSDDDISQLIKDITQCMNVFKIN